jgi:hypothetical protein
MWITFLCLLVGPMSVHALYYSCESFWLKIRNKHRHVRLFLWYHDTPGLTLVSFSDTYGLYISLSIDNGISLAWHELVTSCAGHAPAVCALSLQRGPVMAPCSRSVLILAVSRIR